MVVLHMFVALEKLAVLGERGAAVSQELLDIFFRDMDRSLREMGAGDMGVPHRIKTMAKSFFGRAGAYRGAAQSADREALAAAIGRNVFPDEAGIPAGAFALADYVLDALARGRDDGLSLLSGQMTFPDPAGLVPTRVAR
jgi:cytochrome b pre-mRNA-processing protein 3